MARLRTTERLAPPLMHVFRAAHEQRDARKAIDLRDEAGERILATRRAVTRAPISEAGLRREVVQDVANLMNTVHLGAAEDLSATPEVQRSILNYGFPDLVHRTLDEGAVSDVAAEIRRALVDFEPRLVPDTIVARRDTTVDRAGLQLRFTVQADLRCEPVNVPVEFMAEVEFDTGKIRFDRS